MGNKQAGLDVPAQPLNRDLVWDYRREWDDSQDGSAAGDGGSGHRLFRKDGLGR